MSGPVVYFVQAATGGPIKIGVARNLERRLAALQHQCPVPLLCLATMPGYRDEEWALHRQFAQSRLHGEWFEPTPELWRLIETLQAGGQAGLRVLRCERCGRDRLQRTTIDQRARWCRRCRERPVTRQEVADAMRQITANHRAG